MFLNISTPCAWKEEERRTCYVHDRTQHIARQFTLVKILLRFPLRNNSELIVLCFLRYAKLLLELLAYVRKNAILRTVLLNFGTTLFKVT